MGKKISGHNHTKAQMDHYANQHNPNNKAYTARIMNDNTTITERMRQLCPLNKCAEAKSIDCASGCGLFTLENGAMNSPLSDYRTMAGGVVHS